MFTDAADVVGVVFPTLTTVLHRSARKVVQHRERPSRGRPVWAAPEEDREDCEGRDDAEEDDDGDGDYNGDDRVERPQQDDDADQEEDHGELEQRGNRRDDGADVPLIQSVKACLPQEHVVPCVGGRVAPEHVLAEPLLGKDAEERSGEAKDEAQEEESVDPPRSGRGRRILPVENARNCCVERAEGLAKLR